MVWEHGDRKDFKKPAQALPILPVSVPQPCAQLAFPNSDPLCKWPRLFRRMPAPKHSNREMASRLCWKPYLHNPSLPHYLTKVTTPTLIVWGKQDAIIPLECGEIYQQALPNAKLEVIDQCGHSPQVEKPQEFHKVVTDFLSGLG